MRGGGAANQGTPNVWKTRHMRNKAGDLHVERQDLHGLDIVWDSLRRSLKGHGVVCDGLPVPAKGLKTVAAEEKAPDCLQGDSKLLGRIQVFSRPREELKPSDGLHPSPFHFSALFPPPTMKHTVQLLLP